MPDRTCSIAGCTAPHYARGWCNKHYQAHRTPTQTRLCEVEGCEAPHSSGDMCTKHRARFKRHGSVDGMKEPRGTTPLENFQFYMPGDPPPAPSPTEGCWLWTGGVDANGYGRFICARTTYAAHRFSYEHFVGRLGAAHVRHTCDTPLCVQPAHLLPGTQVQNMQDKVDRDRQGKGEQIASAKLTAADVRAIRKRYAQGGISQQALADMYGISRSVAGFVIRRETWKHVD